MAGVQVLARVEKQPAGDAAVAQVEVIATDARGRAEKRRFEVTLPMQPRVIDWFEQELAPRYTRAKVRAQVLDDDAMINLYFDSRFCFDCFSCEGASPFLALDDPAAYELTQTIAFDYFGPRRVPSHFRRRQAVLVRLHSLLRRHWLRFAWDKLVQRVSPSVKANSRLLEILTRNFVRSRKIRALRRSFFAWKAGSGRRRRARSLLKGLGDRWASARLRGAFDALYDVALAAKALDMVKEFKTPPAKQGLSRENIIRHIMKSQLELSDDAIHNVLQQSPLRAYMEAGHGSPERVPASPRQRDFLQQSPRDDEHEGGPRAERDQDMPVSACKTGRKIVGIRKATSRRRRTSSLSSATSPGERAMGILTPPPGSFTPGRERELTARAIASARREANGNARRASPMAEQLQRQRKQRLQGASEIPPRPGGKLAGRVLQPDTPQLPPLSGSPVTPPLDGEKTAVAEQTAAEVAASDAETAAALTAAARSSVGGDSALSAWRQEAMLKQKMCQGQGDSSFNTTRSSGFLGSSSVLSRRAGRGGEADGGEGPLLVNCTPLSAGLVANKWRVTPHTPPSCHSTSSQDSFARNNASSVGSHLSSAVRKYKDIPETPSQAPPRDPATVTPMPSCASSLQRHMQRTRGAMAKFLGDLGLEQYLQRFVDEDLDVPLLTRMCLADRREFKETLSEMGLSKIGHREKLVRALLDEHERSFPVSPQPSPSACSLAPSMFSAYLESDRARDLDQASTGQRSFRSCGHPKKRKEKKDRKGTKGRKSKLRRAISKRYGTSELPQAGLFDALQKSKRREKEAANLAANRILSHIKRVGKVVSRRVLAAAQAGDAKARHFPPRAQPGAGALPPGVQPKVVRPSFAKPPSVTGFRVRSEYYRKLGLRV